MHKNNFFISYSHVDKKFVKDLVVGLRYFEIVPWIDVEDIRPGTIWREEIVMAINVCHTFIFVISEASVRAESYALIELNHAVMCNKRIIPLLYQNCENIPLSIRDIQWLTFDSFFEGLGELARVLKSPPGCTISKERNDAYLLIKVDGGKEHLEYLYRNRYIVGRNPIYQGNLIDSGMIFIDDQDKAVSKIHFEIRLSPVDNNWYIIDRSRYGVAINQTRNTIDRGQIYRLKDGDVILIGAFTKIIFKNIQKNVIEKSSLDYQKTLPGNSDEDD